jgi:tyrosyl-tRNA synthetase
VPLLLRNHMSRRLQNPLKVGIQSTYVCRSCRAKLFSADHQRLVVQKRWITRNHIRKIQEAEEDWSLRADAIAAGKKQSMLSLLEERGYVNQIIGYVLLIPSNATAQLTTISGRDELDRLLTQKRVGVYCGVDPTAPSLHVGHMVPFMVLAWMYIHGYHSTFLVLSVLPRYRDCS